MRLLLCLLLFVPITFAAEELVEVKPIPSDKQSAIKDAESIVEQAQKALREAQERLQMAHKAVTQETEDEQPVCPEGATNKIVRTRRRVVDKFLLIFKEEIDCSQSRLRIYGGTVGAWSAGYIGRNYVTTHKLVF